MSHQEHKSKGPVSVGCFVLTVSDTRTTDTDTSGRAIREFIERAGHQVAGDRNDAFLVAVTPFLERRYPVS